MKIFAFLLFTFYLLEGCAQSLKLDVRCLAYPREGFFIIDCADQKTWEEYQLSQERRES